MSKVKFSFIIKLVFMGSLLSVLTAAFVMKFLFSISTITMPDFTGVPLENARKVAERLKLDLKVQDEVHSNIHQKGCIVTQLTKPKEKIKKGRIIYVIVSKGSKLVTVPRITGLLKSKAMINLKNSDLEEGYESEVSSRIYKENSIIAQAPAPGENVPFNHRINTLKSSGAKKDIFLMPDFTSKNVSGVYAALKKKNLFVENLKVENEEELESGSVISQNPPAGYPVDEDSDISFTVSLQPSDLSLRKRLIRISYMLEGHNVAKLVKVKVLSLNGSQTLYNEITQPGQSVRLNATVRGDALVQIFIGTELVRELEYRSGGA